MARQTIINICPYDSNEMKKCPDYKGIFLCQFIRTLLGNIGYTCSHTKPSELLGYNLTDKEVSKHVKWRISQ